MSKKRKKANKGTTSRARKPAAPKGRETVTSKKAKADHPKNASGAKEFAGLPPNSVRLEDLPFEPPKAGMVVWAAIYNLGGAGDVLPEFSLPAYRFGVGSNTDGRRGLWYQVDKDDLKAGDASDWAFIWIKMSYQVETLAILTLGNLWIGNRLWSDSKVVWDRPRGVPLVPEKEYSSEPVSIRETFGDVELGVVAVNLHYHIATNFPRAWAYHNVGCYLLRTSFPGHEYHADALLNFFKIGEMLAALMYSVNPELKHIQQATRELGLSDHFTDDDVKNFYRVRSRDAAHDWLTAENVEREDAVDCKMWAEDMLIHHMIRKGTTVLQVQRPGGPRIPVLKGGPDA
jgi:hypothetical protein